MISTGVRRFDLYDLFSVFVPGITLMIGLAPLIPSGTAIPTTAFLIVLSIFGYVAGRTIHAWAVTVDKWADNKRHREVFLAELEEPNLLPEKTLDRFYEATCNTFEDLNLPESRKEAVEKDENLEHLYTLVRSLIHMDSRGRSRTFQAIYSFYRSMWIVSLSLISVYYSYVFLREFGFTTTIAENPTWLSTLGINPFVIGYFCVIISAFVYTPFRKSKRRFQQKFVEYVIIDFLVLYESQEIPDGGDPNTANLR